MPDIKHVWNPDTMSGDWLIVAGDLAKGDDLATSIVVSLFTDRVANADDVPPDGTDDRRGWWGDTVNGRPLGSRLWLLSREKTTQETLNRARDYCREALQWLLDDKVAASVDVRCTYAPPPAAPGIMQINIEVLRPGGGAPQKFNHIWNGKELA